MKSSSGIKRIILLTAIICLFIFISNVGFSLDYGREKDYAFEKIARKLSRGVVNVFTGWIEIPKKIAEAWEDQDPFTGFVVGGVRGFGWAWVRTSAGLYDVVTFAFPYPNDYEPMLKPEFVLADIWGAKIPDKFEY